MALLAYLLGLCHDEELLGGITGAMPGVTIHAVRRVGIDALPLRQKPVKVIVEIGPRSDIAMTFQA